MEEMTPARFYQCLDAIGWSVRGIADRLCVPPARSQRWAEGKYPVPPEVAKWLERLATTHERNPPPKIG